MNDIVKSSHEKAVEIFKSGPRGLEQSTDKSDLILPRAKKIEQMSPEMQDPELLKSGIHPGVIINSITKELLPEQFIPIIYFKQWIRWNANKETDRGWVSGFGPRDLVYMTQDKNDDRLKTDGAWDGDLPPLATTYHNFISLFDGYDVPIVISFGGTNFKTGKTLLSLATFKGGDLFSNKYKLTTKKRQNELGHFFTFDVAFGQKASGGEYARAEELYESFKIKNVQVHTEEE